jgi:hypothetical protein
MVQEKEKEKTSTKKSQKAIANAESVFFQKLSQEPRDGDCGCNVLLMRTMSSSFSARRSVLHVREIAIPCGGGSGNTLSSDCPGYEPLPACPFAAFKVAS